MNTAALEAWLLREDDEFVQALAAELRQHVSQLNAQGGFYAYAVLSLAGDAFRLQYLSAAFNRASEVKTGKASEAYFRFSPDEWANYDLDVFPRTAELVTARNAEFSRLHTKEDPDDYMMDEYETAHIARMHRLILKAMTIVKDEGAVGGDKSFAIVWAPDSSDDILFYSARALNSATTFAAFWKEFGEEDLEIDGAPFD